LFTTSIEEQMLSCTHIRRLTGLSLLIIGTAAQWPASGATTLSSHPLAVAIRHGDCNGAVKLVNPDATLNDAETSFIAGRMLDEGLCVRKDSAAAMQYLFHAVDLGNHGAELDVAGKYGRGEQETQSYEHAGTMCREAGLDPKSEASTYALGYACTIGDLAAAMLRQSLPRGAFRPNSGQLLIEFTPGKDQMRIQSTPHVGEEESHTGSDLRKPIIDAKAEIQKAWNSALAQVPKPDASLLGDSTIEVPLDVDMTLEGGSESARRSSNQEFRPLFNSEVRQVPMP
jgi:hypothetical protein